MGSDDPHKKVKLNVRVPPNQKEDWKDSADENDETLSELVRRAMRRETSNEYVHENHISRDIDLDGIEVEGFGDQLSEIQQSLQELQADVNETVTSSSQQREPLSQDQLETLASRVHDYLPLVDDPTEIQNTEVPAMMDAEERAPITGYLEDLTLAVNDFGVDKDEDADYDIERDLDESDLEYSRIQVREALFFLQDQTTIPVDSLIDDGKRRWFEVD